MVSQDDKLYWWKCDKCMVREEREKFGMPPGWVFIRTKDASRPTEHFCEECSKGLTDKQRANGSGPDMCAYLGLQRKPGSAEAVRSEKQRATRAKTRAAKKRILREQRMACSSLYRAKHSAKQIATALPRGGYPTPKAPAVLTPAEQAERDASLEAMYRDYDETVAMLNRHRPKVEPGS